MRIEGRQLVLSYTEIKYIFLLRIDIALFAIIYRCKDG